MGIAQITSPIPPNSGKLYNFFGRHKRCLARITEPSNDDYDNNVSDNCDNNLGTFDDFGVKNDQKVSNNMILMSKYKSNCQSIVIKLMNFPTLLITTQNSNSLNLMS